MQKVKDVFQKSTLGEKWKCWLPEKVQFFFFGWEKVLAFCLGQTFLFPEDDI